MSLSISIARHDSLLIKSSADVAAGWCKNERGYGFFDCGAIPFPGDRGIEFTLNVRVRPHKQFSHFACFPKDLRASGALTSCGIESVGVYALKDGKAAILVAVDALAVDLERKEGEAIHFEPIVLTKTAHVRIQMNVSVCILPSPPRQIADIP